MLGDPVYWASVMRVIETLNLRVCRTVEVFLEAPVSCSALLISPGYSQHHSTRTCGRRLWSTSDIRNVIVTSVVMVMVMVQLQVAVAAAV